MGQAINYNKEKLLILSHVRILGIGLCRLIAAQTKDLTETVDSF